MDLELRHEHPWDVTPKEAVAIQRELAVHVRPEPLETPVETVAGIDVSIRGDLAQAAVAVVSLPDFEVVDRSVYRAEVPFPYVPGLLSFREMPVVLPALAQLAVRPDVLMTDSQGLAHPRRFGLACHLGVLLDWPAVGVAKSRLWGRHDEPGRQKGASVPLLDGSDVIGAVVRTRTDVKPVYVSIGQRVTLDDAVGLTLRCATRYKLPEPTRLAHHLSRKER